MRFDLLIFDLDGTLVETAPEICDAVNDTLRRFDLPPVSQAQVEGWIGHGTQALLIEALAAQSGTDAAVVRQASLLPEIQSVFAAAYARRSGSRSQPYPGALSALQALRDAGLRLALVSNKEARFARAVLAAHGLSDYFEICVFGDTLPRAKPDPAGVRHCLQRLGVSPERALFLGDSATDVDTARRAGIPVWAFSHGYNAGQPIAQSEPELILHHFSQLQDLLFGEVRI